MLSAQTEEKKKALAREVLSLSAATLLLNMRFLARAVNRLYLVKGDVSFSCDGLRLVFSPDFVLARYKKNERLPVHDYLHSLLHCIFRHYSVGEHLMQKQWDAACDIAVEAVILRCADGFCHTEHKEEKLTELRKLEAYTGLLTAERLYAYFSKYHNDEKDIERLQKLFCTDDHAPWYKNRKREYEDEELPKVLSVGQLPNEDGLPDTSDEGGNGGDGGDGNSRGNEQDLPEGDSDAHEGEQQAEKTEEMPNSSLDDKAQSGEDEQLEEWLENNRTEQNKKLDEMWKEISKQMTSELEAFMKNAGSESKYLVSVLKDIDRDKCDYKAFLRRFAVSGEVMRTDEDSFDVGFYSFGLGLYGNAALIEPLEYKETRLVREFVIAIDTSGSVSGETVKAFVNKTFSILKNEESFFTKVNIYIIQCDTEVREAVKITNSTELDNYMAGMEIKGLGGTDFRPVFEYVDRLCDEGQFKALKGLVYFTDGYGTYPERKPRYETAFAFLKEDLDVSEPAEVPPWASRLVIEESEIKNG